MPEDLAQVSKILGRTSDLAEMSDGLGLFICKHLVAVNQGDLSVFSAGVNLGTTVSFEMHMTEPIDERANPSRQVQINA